MKICLLTYRGNPYCGGQGIYVSSLARELVRQGHEVHGITGPPYPHDISGVTWHRVSGVRLTSDNDVYPPTDNPLSALAPLNFYEWAARQTGAFPEMAAFSVRAFLKVRQLLPRYRFDIIHDNQTLGWGLLPLRALGVPMLATIHHPLTIDRQRGFEPPTSFRQQLGHVRFYPIAMQRFVARRMARIVTVSKASARAISRDFRVPSGNIEVIYNGVDCRLFRPLPEVPRVAGRVLFVGNIEDPNKGGRYLLRAMTYVRPEAHLVVVTGGISDQPTLERELDTLGLRHRITFYSRLSSAALVHMYATAEVAVSPSLFEGFGFPAAEAMACGLPLVAARGGALPEVVGDAGLLVPTRNPQALAVAINTLLRDANLRQRLGQAARARVQTKFRWEEAVQHLVRVYMEMIDAHRRS
jgi:glycosyltransferase involved in cell wall biosynthesis